MNRAGENERIAGGRRPTTGAPAAGPKIDGKANRLIINAIHLEPGVQPDNTTRRAIERAIESLAAFLGATGIDYPANGF